MMTESQSIQKDPEETHPLDEGSRVYCAFRGKRGGGARPTSVLFVPNRGTHMRRLQLAHVHQTDTAFDSTEVIMEFVHQTVVLEGSNLLSLESGIAAGWVSAVVAFNPERHDQPPAQFAGPFVRRIRFYPHEDDGKKKDGGDGQHKPHLVKSDG